MRVLGVDIGEKRVGIAVSDPERRIATPVAVVDATDSGAVRSVVEEWDASLIVVGLPLSMDGSEGAQARRVRDIAEAIERDLRVPVRFFDERLTSAQAKRAMREAGTDEKRARGKVDMVAAALMLQAYLDSEATGDD